MTYTVYFDVRMHGSTSVEAATREEAEDKFLEMSDDAILQDCYAGVAESATIDDIEGERESYGPY